MKGSFIKATALLMVGGFVTKLLGMVIKIIINRLIGTEGIGLYMLILPTFMLFISLSQFGFPIAISKLVAEKKRNSKRLFSSIVPISLVINIILMIIIICFSPFLAKNLLHEERVTLALTSIALVIPFSTLSNIIRSYFFGKNRMLPHVISNIFEDIVRLVLIIIFIPKLKDNITSAVNFLIIVNIFSELSSILIMLLFIPKDSKIRKSDLKPSKIYLKEALTISVPNTSSRLIASLGYFLEPIILTTFLLLSGYSKTFIIREYGIITGYVLPLILLPSFFTLAISQALLPVVSLEYSKRNIKEVKRKIKEALFFSLLIGSVCCLTLVIFPTFFLKLIYNTTLGVNYVRILAPICILQYIEAPLSFAIDAMGKSTYNLKITIISLFVRSSSLILFSLLKIGIYALIISTSINIIVVVYLLFKYTKKCLF
ncbi:MAG: oligosaccharide flippase family protein [Bacilli bacterium]|nr:oligosaccharide flippase family protein [Bacilli bacterium]